MTRPDGEAWRAELERWHAYLVNVVDQACLWAREFHVSTGDGGCSYPLLGYAERLELISRTLNVAAANASLNPPDPGWDRTTMRAPARIRISGRDTDWRHADHSEGGEYLLRIRPTAGTAVEIVTAQQHWREALHFAAPSMLECEFGIPQLATYASLAQELFDGAHETVRAAFHDSVAATFGRMWATASPPDLRTRVLVGWMDVLIGFGCSVEECDHALRDIAVVDPQEAANALTFAERKVAERA